MSEMPREPTRADVDALVGPATPHFAYQLRARVRELVADLAADHPVRRYAERRIALLDPRKVDPDYADELVRSNLGVVRGDEVVLELPKQR